MRCALRSTPISKARHAVTWGVHVRLARMRRPSAVLFLSFLFLASAYISQRQFFHLFFTKLAECAVAVIARQLAMRLITENDLE